MAATIDKSKCTGCSECKDACPIEAIKIEGDKATVDVDACVECGACVDTCPNGAITL